MILSPSSWVPEPPAGFAHHVPHIENFPPHPASRSGHQPYASLGHLCPPGKRRSGLTDRTSAKEPPGRVGGPRTNSSNPHRPHTALLWWHSGHRHPHLQLPP